MNQHRRKRKKSMPFISKAIIVIILAASIYGAWSLAGNFMGTNGVNRAITDTINAVIPNNNGMNQPQNDMNMSDTNSATHRTDAFEFTSVHISEIADTRYLELLNREHGLSTEPDRSLIVDAWPTLPVSTRDITLHISARSAVDELFEAARRDDSIGTFFVSSGYRDFHAQEQLYNSGMDRSLVLPPGHSEHHTGLAVDILAVGIGQFELSNSAEGRWLADNSWRFGLILRYPKSRENVTSIAYEPWHFRYVGQPHTWYMWNNDMVLEEYIEFIRETGNHTIIYDGREYTVIHQMPVNGMLQIPNNANFTVSSDGTGGFVITVLE